MPLDVPNMIKNWNKITGEVGALSEYFTCTNRGVWKNKWIIDSGASLHYCNDLGSFMDYPKFSKHKKTIVGDGRIVLGYSSGTVWWKAPDNSETPIYNVIFTLEMKQNLLSIKKVKSSEEEFWTRRPPENFMSW